jgi:hypothetical protein
VVVQNWHLELSGGLRWLVGSHAWRGKVAGGVGS